MDLFACIDAGYNAGEHAIVFYLRRCIALRVVVDFRHVRSERIAKIWNI